MRGLEKIVGTPLMCICAILQPISEARSRLKHFFLLSQVLHQNETAAGSQGTKIKFSLKINSP
jgi:hypothetical protein